MERETVRAVESLSLSFSLRQTLQEFEIFDRSSIEAKNRLVSPLEEIRFRIFRIVQLPSPWTSISLSTSIDPSSRSGSGLNSVQGQIDERSASFVLRTREKVVAMKTASSVPTFQQHLLGYFHIDVGAEMGSEPRMTPVVVTLNQLERVYGVERGRRGRESWVASWIFSQSNVNSTKTEITGLEGHYNPPATTNVSSNLTTRFLFPSRPFPSPSRYPASR